MPKFVYIIYYNNWEDSEISGVYLSKEEAINKAKEENKRWDTSAYSVQEWNLAEQTFDEFYFDDPE